MTDTLDTLDQIDDLKNKIDDADYRQHQLASESDELSFKIDMLIRRRNSILSEINDLERQRIFFSKEIKSKEIKDLKELPK
jgi:uncharacterized coiled-coil DUF342 family protein